MAIISSTFDTKKSNVKKIIEWNWFLKKNLYQIGGINSMYDPESLKVTMLMDHCTSGSAPSPCIAISLQCKPDSYTYLTQALTKVFNKIYFKIELNRRTFEKCIKNLKLKQDYPKDNVWDSWHCFENQLSRIKIGNQDLIKTKNQTEQEFGEIQNNEYENINWFEIHIVNLLSRDWGYSRWSEFVNLLARGDKCGREWLRYSDQSIYHECSYYVIMSCLNYNSSRHYLQASLQASTLTQNNTHKRTSYEQDKYTEHYPLNFVLWWLKLND